MATAPEGLILPYEMLLEIFSYLEVQEIEASVAPVCRLWRDASRLPVVRRRLTLTKEIKRSAALEMLRGSPLLTELTIDEGWWYSNDLLETAAAHNLKLRVLEINGHVTDIGFEAVAQCTLLRTLWLHDASGVDDHNVEHLARLRELESLKLMSWNRVTAAHWRHLFSTCEWPHLRELSLCLYDEDEDEEEEPQMHFDRLPTTLRSIELCGPVSDMDLEAVAQCSDLRTLTIRSYEYYCSEYWTRVTDDGVMHLARLRHLEKLKFEEAHCVSRAGWRRLFSMCEWPHLRELRLALGHDLGDSDGPHRQAELLCPNVSFC